MVRRENRLDIILKKEEKKIGDSADTHAKSAIPRVLSGKSEIFQAIRESASLKRRNYTFDDANSPAEATCIQCVESRAAFAPDSGRIMHSGAGLSIAPWVQ